MVRTLVDERAGFRRPMLLDDVLDAHTACSATWRWRATDRHPGRRAGVPDQLMSVERRPRTRMGYLHAALLWVPVQSTTSSNTAVPSARTTGAADVRRG